MNDAEAGYFAGFGLRRAWSDDATSARLTRSREPRVAHVTYPLSRRWALER